MDRAAFYAALRSRANSMFGTSLSQAQVTTLDLILDEGERRGLILTHLAYVLATPYHEVGSSLRPKTENLNYTSAARIRAVWPSRFKSITAQPYVRQPQKLANVVYGGRLGNIGPNDGWTYRGRGLCQITGKANYARFSNLLGIDLVNHPDRALEPRIAVAVMFEGMIFGLFTGKKLADYLNATATNYYAARAIINGDVKANGETIASYARQFEAALKAAGYSSQKPQPAPTIPASKPAPVPAPSMPAPQPSAPAQPAGSKTRASGSILTAFALIAVAVVLFIIFGS